MGRYFLPIKSEESQVSSEESQLNSELTTQSKVYKIKEKKKKNNKKKKKSFKKSDNPIFCEKNKIEKMEKRERNYLFVKCMKIYLGWFLKITGVPAKIDGTQGRALKYIITYLKSINSDEEKVAEAFSAILDSYELWSNFHKKQLKLTQINSNLPNIIHEVKNGKTTKTISSIGQYYDEIVGSSDFRNFEGPDDSKLFEAK